MALKLIKLTKKYEKQLCEMIVTISMSIWNISR